MRKISRKQKLAVAAAGTVAAVAVAGTAYAYWTASGGGTGSGSAGSISTGIQVHQTSTVSGLYPNSTPQALSGNFGNTNNSAAYVTSVKVALNNVTTAGTDALKPACTAADFALSATSTGSATDNGDGTFTIAVGQEIPGQAGQGANAYAGSWSGVSVQLVDNTLANQDNCKGATINLTYTSA